MSLPEAPNSILVICTRRIGDVVLVTPVMRSLKTKWPDTEIHALVFEGTEGALENNPDVARVIKSPPSPAARTATRSRAQHIESAEDNHAAQDDHRWGVLAEVEDRSCQPARDAKSSGARHRVLLICGDSGIPASCRRINTNQRVRPVHRCSSFHANRRAGPRKRQKLQ
jgi:hypothetical protein